MTKEELWKTIWESGVERISCLKCPFEHECYESAPTDNEHCADYLRNKYNKELLGE